MKREIRFRAISKDSHYGTGHFVYGSLVLDFETYIVVHKLPSDPELPLVPVDLKTVGQFIGKQDKNEKDIYEGDIVKWLDDGVEYTGPVFFDQNAVGFRVKMVIGYMPSFKLQSHHLEVIGNTFQNIDLLPPSFRE